MVKISKSDILTMYMELDKYHNPYVSFFGKNFVSPVAPSPLYNHQHYNNLVKRGKNMARRAFTEKEKRYSPRNKYHKLSNNFLDSITLIDPPQTQSIKICDENMNMIKLFIY